MPDVLRLGIALACFAGGGSAIAAPTPTVRTVVLRLTHDATPWKLQLTVEATASRADEPHYLAVSKIEHRPGEPSELVHPPDVIDVGENNAPVCVDAGCAVQMQDGRFRYSLDAESSLRSGGVTFEYYVVVRGVDPRITVTGAGWRRYSDLAVYAYDATSAAGGSRTPLALGVDRETFRGTAASPPLRASVAYAALPCEHTGSGTGALRANAKSLVALSCDGAATGARYSAATTCWQNSGAVENGVTNSRVRLLVVGRK